MDRQLVDRLWFAGEAVPGAAFRLNDSVEILAGDEILAGEHTGNGGAVISIERLTPEPIYLVELGDTGEDVRLSESNLSAP